MELPGYLPLNRDLTRVVEKCGASGISASKQTEVLAERIYKTCKQWVDYSIGNGTATTNATRSVLEANLTVLTEVFRTQYKADIFKASFDASKRKVRDLSATEDEVTLDNLDNYHNIANDERRLNFGDFIINEYNEQKNYRETDFLSFLRNKNQYRQVQSFLVILDNPEAPIPDENGGDEDDLNISGGTISLKDPILLNIFEDPVISKVCKHTFERQSIVNHLQTSNDCPIAGCSAKLNMNSLQPDDIMRLRVNVYKQKGKNKKDTNVARLE